MNEIDHIRKSLANVKEGEKGWRKVLATAEGSFSRTLAEKNLNRLAALRELLTSQLMAAGSEQQRDVQAAPKPGMLAADLSGSLSEGLLKHS